MGMILCIASSHIVGEGDIVGRSGCFKFKLSANSVMRGRVNAIRTFKGLVADLRYIIITCINNNLLARGIYFTFHPTYPYAQMFPPYSSLLTPYTSGPGNI